MAKYEWKFAWLSKYVREIVPTEFEMCIHFESGMNDEIHMLAGALELWEFTVISERA